MVECSGRNKYLKNIFQSNFRFLNFNAFQSLQEVICTDLLGNETTMLDPNLICEEILTTTKVVQVGFGQVSFKLQGWGWPIQYRLY